MTRIELPRDGVGREIPFDTKVLCTAGGSEICADDFVYGLAIHVNESAHDIVPNGWRVHSGCNAFDVNRLYLKRPDNPTCRNLSNDCRSFHCSRCGYKAFTYGDSDCDPEDFTYCPECRAEVVEDDQR